MNYRHHFHAGNFADVFKHTLAIAVLRALQQKEKGLLVLDTHAGRGRYDLSGAAQGDRLARTPEWPEGIGRVEAAAGAAKKDGTKVPGAVREYLRLVAACRVEGGGAGGAAYPGSPWLWRALRRGQDRVVLAELQPAEHGELDAEFHAPPAVRVEAVDGYNAVRAHLPPKERRALVLIDPPFEAAEEPARIAEAVGAGLRRLPGGTFAVWYPLTARAQPDGLLARLERETLPPTWTAELTVRLIEPSTPGMSGCGLVVINPPWRLAEEFAPTLAWLGEVLRQERGGAAELRWIVPER